MECVKQDYFLGNASEGSGRKSPPRIIHLARAVSCG